MIGILAKREEFSDNLSVWRTGPLDGWSGD